MPRVALEESTGSLFEKLWAPYDDRLFEESVQLFVRRLEIVGFDTAWFEGRTVLDAGCGGGRNTIAMARLGAREAHGIDLGWEGILNARERARQLPAVRFEQASILNIPFEDERFDLAWCAGVMMITDDEDRALAELTRVLKPGGLLYLLVYADEGMRWPLIKTLRPIARWLGKAAVEAAMQVGELPANKRRTFLDDLFCPKLDFYNWDRLRRMLERLGYADIRRWGPEARLDHEQSLAEYRADLEWLAAMFAAGARVRDGEPEIVELFRQGEVLTGAVVDSIRWFEQEVAQRRTSEAEAMEIVIGQGHHRVLATKGA